MKMYALLIHGDEQQEAVAKAKADFSDIELISVKSPLSGRSFLAAELEEANHPFVRWLREYSFTEWSIVALGADQRPAIWDDSKAILNQ